MCDQLDPSIEKPKFYITTPIYYPSDKLHIGHSYTTVAADTMARYKRARGFDVMFLTGTDEHGQKIEKKAEESGVTPKQFVDKVVAGIKDLWELLDISYDRFIRTTDEQHQRCVQHIFTKLYEQGDIYLDKYEGWYCTPCESFWTDSQLDDGNCPDCGRPVHKTKEESYFFRLSKYQDRLIDIFENNPECVQPSSRANEMLNNFLRPGLEDLAVSRTSFDWGIPVPFNDKHIIYVWVDALVNYISAMGYPDVDGDYARFWPADVHLVGKEIVRFHTIIWPALLMAMDLPLPKQVFGHGWLLFNKDKMSKSLGNVVDPVVLCGRYGVDAIRYFLLREVPFGSDGSFSNSSLVNRINSDLANDLGNLLSRTTAMIAKYFDGVLPESREREAIDEDLVNLCHTTKCKVEDLMEQLQFSLALTEIWELIKRCNKYIDETTPWLLAKDENKQIRLATVLYNLAEVQRIVSVLLAPFLPSTATKIQEALQIPTDEPAQVVWDSADAFGAWKQKGAVTAAKPIFPRLDVDKEIDELNIIYSAAAPQEADTEVKKPEKTNEQVSEGVQLIDFTDFTKVQLLIAQVKSCAKVEGSDKLLCSQLLVGEETRQVVSGIADFYQPEEMVGKQVVLVANLKPRKIFGLESHGMLLCAEDKKQGALRLIQPDVPVATGSEVG